MKDFRFKYIGYLIKQSSIYCDICKGFCLVVPVFIRKNKFKWDRLVLGIEGEEFDLFLYDKGGNLIARYHDAKQEFTFFFKSVRFAKADKPRLSEYTYSLWLEWAKGGYDDEAQERRSFLNDHGIYIHHDFYEKFESKKIDMLRGEPKKSVA